MKVAVLSDIHGNIVALRAVLVEAEAAGVEKYLFLGDLVGYYYHPAECLTELLERQAVMIQGNHERMLKSLVLDPYLASSIRSRFGSGLDRAREQLSKGQLDLVLGLPETRELAVGGASIYMAHGSPQDPDRYVYPDSPTEVRERCLEVGTDYVFLGHTHRPFIFKHDGRHLVNVGSVGQPRDRGGYASWAVLDTRERVVTLNRTPYDVSPVANEAAMIDPHLPFLVDVLRRP